MRLLLDTRLLVWAAEESDRLSRVARGMIEDPGNEPMFSAARSWDVSIKYGFGRADFASDPGLLWGELRDHGYGEIAVTASHGSAMLALPPIQKDPFDRLLIAQSVVGGIVLLTSDPVMVRSGGLVRQV